MGNIGQRVGMRLVVAGVFGAAAAVLLLQVQLGPSVVFGTIAAVFLAGAVQAGRGAGGSGPADR
ncbi:hypothetical protein Cfla_3268 [Cellulomonas flavigena DSM 20109]|uniref:Uncharacterized protein n=1 Tax=Cellulomonas flavigena (strain ATCC 482 / DSM 20109 / BCRC 11376 / JCM 18109 / NBRC 3775 / NCIMB 8073 / NRS 134) TaxID=446466 RepID=D5UBZ0_CELFN|nr:hypothetical protein [Cellulomonas flavigena]ADG76149.1 hypothetical protein Cfla_3268 [Cellulomonas flavigena DSM 20109]